MKKYLELIRIKHWIKNILIFIPLISNGKLIISNVLNCIICFIAFSFMSSFVYILNDIKDIEKDKLHPRKKKRPLPSKRIKKSIAIYIAILMLIASIIINTLINKNIFNISLYLLLLYMIINISYSCGLKNIAILDIVLLAAGFVIRIYYGASIVEIEVSNWLFLTVLNGSLFLGLGKRKKELINNKDTRKVLIEYNESFLDKFQYLTLTLMIIFYSLWSMEKNINYLMFTIPILMIIFMKYCLIVEKSDEGDPTTILYQDKFLLFLCTFYVIIMFIILVLL